MSDLDSMRSTVVFPWARGTYQRLIDLEALTTIVMVLFTIVIAYLQNPGATPLTWFRLSHFFPLFIILPNLYRMTRLLTALHDPDGQPSAATLRRFGITSATHPFRIHQVFRRELIIHILFMAIPPSIYLAAPLGLLGINPALMFMFSLGLILTCFTYWRYPHPPTFPPYPLPTSTHPTNPELQSSSTSLKVLFMGTLVLLGTIIIVGITANLRIDPPLPLIVTIILLNFLALFFTPATFVYPLLTHYEHSEALPPLYSNRT